MADPVFVQETDGNLGTTSSSASLGVATPVGNLLLAGILWDSFATFTSLSDDVGNLYTQIGSEHSANFTNTRLYWARNGTATVRTLTGQVSAGSTFCQVFLAEYTGHNSTPIDSFNVGDATNVTVDATLSDTTISDRSLLIAWGIATHPTASIATAGFTQRNPASGSVLADLLISPPEGTTVAFHNTVTPVNWILWLVALAASPPPPFVSPYLPIVAQ